MDLKRITSALLGLPMVLLILILGNTYITDIMFALVAVLSLHEYFNAMSKITKPVRLVGYTSCAIIALASILPGTMIPTVIMYGIPILLLILFLCIIATNMKITFKDISYTIFGIIYIVLCIMFLALIRGLEYGKIFLGYAIIAAWGTDIFAYLVGKKFGKHKFSKISPKKSIEGCIGGGIGAVLCASIYTLIITYFINIDISYIYIIITTMILSIISQIGDFAASSIKRMVDIKDFSNLIPGHGGMLDRIDSLIFLAPFAYMLFNLMKF